MSDQANVQAFSELVRKSQGSNVSKKEREELLDKAYELIPEMLVVTLCSCFGGSCGPSVEYVLRTKRGPGCWPLTEQNYETCCLTCQDPLVLNLLITHARNAFPSFGMNGNLLREYFEDLTQHVELLNVMVFLTYIVYPIDNLPLDISDSWYLKGNPDSEKIMQLLKHAQKISEDVKITC